MFRSQVVQIIVAHIFNHENQTLCLEVWLLGEASRLEATGRNSRLMSLAKSPNFHLLLQT